MADKEDSKLTRDELREKYTQHVETEEEKAEREFCNSHPGFTPYAVIAAREARGGYTPPPPPDEPRAPSDDPDMHDFYYGH